MVKKTAGDDGGTYPPSKWRGLDRETGTDKTETDREKEREQTHTHTHYNKDSHPRGNEI